MHKTWTNDEIEILKNSFTIKSKKEIQKLLDSKTWEAIRHKALKFGLNRGQDGDWTKVEIDLLTKVYPDTKNSEIWGLFPGRSVPAIKGKVGVLKLYKNKNYHGRWWHDNEIEFLKVNYPYGNKKDICEKLKTKSWDAIKIMAEKLDIKRKLIVQREADPYRLLEESNEAYYWAGFLMADGCINHKTSRLLITLAKKDKKHLEKFSKFVKGPKVKRVVPNYIYKGIFKKKLSYKIDFQNKEIIPKFSIKFDFKPNKTENPPNSFEFKTNHFLSFFIGYIDGDGHISKPSVSPRKQSRIVFQVHRNWLNTLKNFETKLYSIMNLSLEPKSKLNKKNYASLSIGKFEIVKFLKEKALELNIPFLNRKWDRIDETYSLKKKGGLE